MYVSEAGSATLPFRTIARRQSDKAYGPPTIRSTQEQHRFQIWRQRLYGFWGEFLFRGNTPPFDVRNIDSAFAVKDGLFVHPLIFEQQQEIMSEQAQAETTQPPVTVVGHENVATAAARLIDPEDLRINTAINERDYSVRCAVSRQTSLMVEDWLSLAEKQFATNGTLLISLDIKQSETTRNRYDGEDDEPAEGLPASSEYGTYVFDTGDSICVIYLSSQNQAFFHFWSDSYEVSRKHCDWIIENLYTYSRVEVLDEETNKRMLSFWGQMGGDYKPYNRRIELLPWGSETKQNYPTEVLEQLEGLMALTPPVLGGRLILFHGPPGTGKTSLIRTMARHFTKWCHTSYIMDPEYFLGISGNMMSVITYNYEQYIDNTVDSADAHHLLVIEDADELVGGHAKEQSGQSLSRLLNIADGLLGQSTNLLICITTNKPMNELHPAITRAGRCLANVYFDKFKFEEAVAWLQAHGIEGDHKKMLRDSLDADNKPRTEWTLAELYEVVGRITQITHRPQAEEYVNGVYL